MPSTTDIFSPGADVNFADYGISPTGAERQIHLALATRTLPPDERHLRDAAAWLARLFAALPEKTVAKAEGAIKALADKSALVIRMAHAHVPALAAALERSDSPLFPLEQAARKLPLPPLAAGSSPALVSELRQAIAEIKLPADVPAENHPDWMDYRRRVQNLIRLDNPERFLTWPPIIVSMFMDDTRIAAEELAALQARPDYASRWLPALREDALGTPARTSLLADGSNNLIHHAYNLLQLELHTHASIDKLASILEFGGGYGSTARLAFRLGFRGTYVIFDLPEFVALQRFYLKGLGLPFGTAIRSTSSLADLQELIPAPDLFLATWSFSEAPVAFRENFLPFVTAARHLLIAYQKEAFGIFDNVSYFRQLGAKLRAKVVHDYTIGHMPSSCYLVAGPA